MVAFLPLIKGLVFGSVGFLIGAFATAGVRKLLGLPAFNTGPTFTMGYLSAVIGWLMGIGMWDYWAKEWFGLPLKKEVHQGWSKFLRFNTDHKVVGIQYLVTLVVIMLLAGLLAMLMRIELASPGETIMGAGDYNTAMTLHGIMMVAVAVATVMGGFANFLVPLMIGAEDVAFPRLNAFSYWIVPPVAILLLATPFFGGVDAGWTAYPPLSVVNANGSLLFLLAFLTFGFSSIFGGLNFLVTIITLRAPGMTWGRLPIFVWSIFAAAIISLTGTQVVALGLITVILDRVVHTSFYAAANGGNPLLYEHIFWFYSHPAVYIMILPAFGIALEMLVHFSRKPLFAYKWVVGSLLTIVALSYVVWAHHLFTSGMSNYLHLPFMVLTELISIPTGMIFLAGIGTIWQGKLWLRTPMLFALGFLMNFVIGGVTGIFLADVATDIHLQDTYFVVAHFHYTIMGGEIFAIIGALYYWFPKITGRMYNERMGQIHFWWLFLAYNFTFIAMFYVGLLGMNRRVADYIPQLSGPNMVVSLGAFVLGASFLLFAFNLVYSWIKGPKAEANPWKARTLEWQTSSPPPLENFPSEPTVIGPPYGYGQPGAIHARFAPAGGADDKPQRS